MPGQIQLIDSLGNLLPGQIVVLIPCTMHRAETITVDVFLVGIMGGLRLLLCGKLLLIRFNHRQSAGEIACRRQFQLVANTPKSLVRANSTIDNGQAAKSIAVDQSCNKQ